MNREKRVDNGGLRSENTDTEVVKRKRSMRKQLQRKKAKPSC